jgi:hypothetical protein
VASEAERAEALTRAADEQSDELVAVWRLVSVQVRCWVEDCGVSLVEIDASLVEIDASLVEIEVIEEVDSVFADGLRRAGTMVALELSLLEACVVASLVSLSFGVWALARLFLLHHRRHQQRSTTGSHHSCHDRRPWHRWRQLPPSLTLAQRWEMTSQMMQLVTA